MQKLLIKKLNFIQYNILNKIKNKYHIIESNYTTMSFNTDILRELEARIYTSKTILADTQPILTTTYTESGDSIDYTQARNDIANATSLFTAVQIAHFNRIIDYFETKTHLNVCSLHIFESGDDKPIHLVRINNIEHVDDATSHTYLMKYDPKIFETCNNIQSLPVSTTNTTGSITTGICYSLYYAWDLIRFKQDKPQSKTATIISHALSVFTLANSILYAGLCISPVYHNPHILPFAAMTSSVAINGALIQIVMGFFTCNTYGILSKIMFGCGMCYINYKILTRKE